MTNEHQTSKPTKRIFFNQQPVFVLPYEILLSFYFSFAFKPKPRIFCAISLSLGRVVLYAVIRLFLSIWSGVFHFFLVQLNRFLCFFLLLLMTMMIIFVFVLVTRRERTESDEQYLQRTQSTREFVMKNQRWKRKLFKNKRNKDQNRIDVRILIYPTDDFG